MMDAEEVERRLLRAESLAGLAVDSTKARAEMMAALVTRLDVLSARVSSLEARAGDDLVIATLNRTETLDARIEGLEARTAVLEAAITPGL